MLTSTNVDNAEPWDFAAHPAADLVIINIGTNDVSYSVADDAYADSLTKLIQGVHGVWPDAQVLIMVSPSSQPILSEGNTHLPKSLSG